jgi:hypothetical protein
MPTRKKPKLNTGEADSRELAKTTFASATTSAYRPSRTAVVAA